MEISEFYRNLRPVPPKEESKEKPKTDFELIFDEIKRKIQH